MAMMQSPGGVESRQRRSMSRVRLTTHRSIWAISP